jgi:gamma-glutamyl:cysteine ligase YbdK (ATP-grasp superfamily)
MKYILGLVVAAFLLAEELPEKIPEADARSMLQLQVVLAQATAAREKARADYIEADQRVKSAEEELKKETARIQTAAKCIGCQVDKDLKWVRPKPEVKK